jgi:MFS superfamily sulfate permease-like transporter
MKKLFRTALGLVLLAPLLFPQAALAAGDKASPIVIVADTRGLKTWAQWWANLYNESHLYFTILTVITIPVVGLIFGILADLIMSLIGLDLKSRELAEH